VGLGLVVDESIQIIGGRKMVELVKKEEPAGIWVGDMMDGDIGVIVEWNNSLLYLGRIVQRYGDDLVAIGLSSGGGWSESLSRPCRLPSSCRVRLLEKGEMLIVV
jgi:hypothetical protein